MYYLVQTFGFFFLLVRKVHEDNLLFYISVELYTAPSTFVLSKQIFFCLLQRILFMRLSEMCIKISLKKYDIVLGDCRILEHLRYSFS